MPGFFISKLPSGHAVKDNTKAAAIASLRGDDIVKATPANTVPLLRQQCAAIVRLRRDVCTADYLEKLALADRAYLLKLCGLLGGGTSKARSRCILDRPNLHPGDGGFPPGGGGGGGPARGRGLIQQRGPIGQQLNGRRRRRRRRGSLPATLLSSAAVSAFNLLGRADLARLLDEAGVPYDSGDNVSILHDKSGVTD